MLLILQGEEGFTGVWELIHGPPARKRACWTQSVCLSNLLSHLLRHNVYCSALHDVTHRISVLYIKGFPAGPLAGTHLGEEKPTLSSGRSLCWAVRGASVFSGGGNWKQGLETRAGLVSSAAYQPWSSGSQRTLPATVASGTLLEMQILKTLPRPTASEAEPGAQGPIF